MKPLLLACALLACAPFGGEAAAETPSSVVRRCQARALALNSKLKIRIELDEDGNIVKTSLRGVDDERFRRCVAKGTLSWGFGKNDRLDVEIVRKPRK